MTKKMKNFLNQYYILFKISKPEAEGETYNKIIFVIPP